MVNVIIYFYSKISFSAVFVTGNTSHWSQLHDQLWQNFVNTANNQLQSFHFNSNRKFIKQQLSHLILPYTDVCIALHTWCFPSVWKTSQANRAGFEPTTSCLLVQTS